MAATGLLLNHAALFDLGVEGPPLTRGTGAIGDVGPINDLLKASLRAAIERNVRIVNSEGASRPSSGPSAIDRAVFRPDTRTVQVRLRDPLTTEVVLDWSTGAILDVAPRHDVRLRHVHSAESLGQRGVIVSDIVAVVLVLLALTGIVLKIVRPSDQADGSGRSRWLAFNSWFHRVAGLAAVTYLAVLGVTGVMLNHKREWGFMVEPERELEAENVARLTPSRLPVLVRTAAQALARRNPATTAAHVRFVDYRPLSGYAKVRFEPDETEVIVNAYSGQILSIARRGDRWLEDLHSGLAFGSYGRVLSDVTGLLLIVLTVNGLYLWVRPAWISRGRPEAGAAPATQAREV